LPIVNAHQHFCDFDRNYHSWLRATELIPIRYVDYRALRRSYLLPGCCDDMTRNRFVSAVHAEAVWNRAAWSPKPNG
jgi:predicted TIM-barrel fold metal-dependent hydrolase